MAGKLITLPLRVSLRSARLLTHVAGGMAARALSLAGRTIGAVTPGRSGAEHHYAAPAPPPQQRADTSAPRRETPSVTAVSSIRTPGIAPAPPPPEAPAVQEPAHVSEEPELVEEFAEPGAEEGAGAAITVAEPWNGYEQMSAKDVIARARHADRAELAAVRLYESHHRSRRTVLAAVDRQLRLGNGSRSGLTAPPTERN